MSPLFHVVGLMSGTSLDGVDLAYCRFFKQDGKWSFELICAETSHYPDTWKNNLADLVHADALALSRTHAELGKYFAEKINAFILKNSLKPDFISSHGHTVFHQPENGFTLQIGDGAAISSLTGLPVVCDFRSGDVALGGQGAPLVPIGDQLLFGEYDFCLNLGGIANISFQSNQHSKKEMARLAFDICPVNMALNYLSMKKNLPYDKDGQLASKGTVNRDLLKKLNALEFYSRPAPKSLGAEWFNQNIKPLIDDDHDSIENRMHTCVEHIAEQVALVVGKNAEGSNKARVLVTGGGAHNTFLVDQLREKVPADIIVPAADIVDFKEAILFAFLGALRICGETNVLKSVTGATADSCGGALYDSTGRLSLHS